MIKLLYKFPCVPGMLMYKGKELTKFKNKHGGKNRSETDGFYRDSDGVEYFVKKPDDPKELFTELFAGLLLQEFIRRGLIAEIYQDSFICADWIQFSDGSYGLIQPKVSFKELFKIIGTGYRDGSDRDFRLEMLWGPQSYLTLTQLKHYYGLAIILMFSLLLGDQSVHSGNVVCLEKISLVEVIFIQFARIDWGAAFRYFGHKKNNEDLLYPFEYHGWLNPKSYTKGYFLNYKKIKGLFSAIAEHACILQSKLSKELLIDMISSTLKTLPADLIKENTKMELAKYLCIESFAQISFTEEEKYQQFSNELAEILYARLQKITVIQDFASTAIKSNLSEMEYVESQPMAISLPVNVMTPFIEQMSMWQYILSLSDESSIFDFNSIELTKLGNQYNCFMDNILGQAERLTQYLDENEHVTQMSSFLRDSFTLDGDLVPHPSSKIERILCTQTYWDVVETLLSSGFNTLVTIKVIKNTQNSNELGKESAIHSLFEALTDCLSTLNKTYQQLLNELEACLLLLSGTQLVMICQHEMECISVSLLIRMVVKHPELWTCMYEALINAYDVCNPKKAEHNLVPLLEIHKNYHLFLNLSEQWSSIGNFDTQEVLVDKMNRLFESFPEPLQAELALVLNKIQIEFKEERRRRSLDFESLEEFSLSSESEKEKEDIKPPVVNYAGANQQLFFSQSSQGIFGGTFSRFTKGFW